MWGVGVGGWGSPSCIQLINTSLHLSDANSRARPSSSQPSPPLLHPRLRRKNGPPSPTSTSTPPTTIPTFLSLFQHLPPKNPHGASIQRQRPPLHPCRSEAWRSRRTAGGGGGGWGRHRGAQRWTRHLPGVRVAVVNVCGGEKQDGRLSLETRQIGSFHTHTHTRHHSRDRKIMG